MGEWLIAQKHADRGALDKMQAEVKAEMEKRRANSRSPRLIPASTKWIRMSMPETRPQTAVAN